jgi:hypothetical protein
VVNYFMVKTANVVFHGHWQEIHIHRNVDRRGGVTAFTNRTLRRLNKRKMEYFTLIPL